MASEILDKAEVSRWRWGWSTDQDSSGAFLSGYSELKDVGSQGGGDQRPVT